MNTPTKIPCGGFYLGDGLTMDGNTLKSSGGGEQIQTDWNQNDPTAKDYIKNRPGGYTKPTPGYEITWDGVVGDKVVVDGGEMQLVKVSDRVFTVEELIGATMIFGNQSFTINNDDIESQNGAMLVHDCALVCTTPTTISGITIPEAGTYFVKVGEEFVSSLSKPDSTTTIKIPEEYLELTETNEAISVAISAASTAQSAASMAKTTADTAKTTADTAKTAADKANSEIRTKDLWFHSSETEQNDPNVPYGIKIGSVNSLMENPRIAMTTADGLIMCGDASNPSEAHIQIKVKRESDIPFGYIEVYSKLGDSVTITPTKIAAAKADATIKSLYCLNGITLKSSTSGSTKKFSITVDDSGALKATEVTA